jgi:hypothetical protein
MAPRRRPVSNIEDPLAYALETHRMARELRNYIFPPWRWPGWYRRRRVIEQRLTNLRAMQEADRLDEAD